MDIKKERIAHEKHLLSQGVDFKYLPNIQYSELENVYELIEWDEEYSEALNEINSSWCTWQAAKAQAIPEGFVLVPKENIFCYWQDNDEPENFCSSESDFDNLGDCIELGDIMEINKHTQAHIQTEKLSGTWFAEAIDPSEKANFFVGTHEECMAIVEKNKAMIEAQEPTND
ncbi:hypothetical protein [Acinetobacter sp. YH01020]|uniref:hypothetical protein n=1 Tax=Acinetobacter sp. YH01020 TaxID=2601034 RepID=UPI00211EE322|nr:hypothetical protein [Acinetobacter sp. YH01020]